MTDQQASPKAWVLYDASCGFCGRWVRLWAGTLRRRGFDIAPLQAPWVRERLEDEQGALLKDLRVLLSDGTLVDGADAYRYLMRRIWWAYPAFVISRLPGFRRVFDSSYRTFARNRFRFSKMCGLAVPDEAEQQK